MRRLPGITVVAALTVLTSAVVTSAAPAPILPFPVVRAGAESPEGRPARLRTPPATATEAATKAGPRSGRQAAFTEAARRYGVPESVLLAVSYLESRWEGHGGLPSVSAGYGPMHLVDGRAEPGRPHGVGADAQHTTHAHSWGTLPRRTISAS
ncbi:hypothetical protein AB0C32_32730, partial [Streptosporangium sp. NPDC048865]